MEEHQLTVHDIRSVAGPVWMVIIDIIAIVVGFCVKIWYVTAGGAAFIIIAIPLFIIIGIRNSKIQNVLKRQYFRCICADVINYLSILEIEHLSIGDGLPDTLPVLTAKPIIVI